jgi:type II secretory ATPase GspE/PulE/Tfp pilus assembly ATPase PilB-like protein/ActR/RegA family two-component response regulator
VAQFRDEWLGGTVAQLVGEDKLEELREAEDPKPTLWETVVSQQAATDEQLLGALASRFRVKIADLSQLDESCRDLVPEEVARKYHVLPIQATDSYLEIATANPFDLDCEKTLAFATGREVRVLLASPAVIEQRLDTLYGGGANLMEKILDGMDAQEVIIEHDEDEEPEDMVISEAEASQRPVVRMVDLILSEGILSRASDIHIEPEERGVAVRYRIDGVLRQVMDIPRAAGLPLISRLKIIASLDIADRLRPQDGRARVVVNEAAVDLRISTLPASLGEKVVIRILDSTRTVLSLESLGLNKEEIAKIHQLLAYRDGIILVTGPTGSGKTTTLYSAIRHVQSEGVNIVTVEDPVEYRLQGIVQVQVHEKAGLTFAAALRSILRQDPDVVLVGEIRDLETAQIAVQASLTGHLVLSTLHTNDAANAVTRMVDLGVEAFKIGSAVRGVIAQRLMRTLCPKCREERTEPAPAKLEKWLPEGHTLYRAVGCQECAMTGYRGRFSIVEVLETSPEVEQRIANGENAYRIADAAVAEGMKSLWDSGLGHVLKGDSTVEELLRVVDMPQDGDIPAEAASLPASEPDTPTPAATVEAETASPPEGTPAATATVVAPAPGDTEVDGDPADGPLLDDDITREAFELLEGSIPGVADGGDGSRVLLVDDEDQLRRVMRDLLEREGYTVFEASDGAEALEQVDVHAPDILVLDLNLPGLDGYGVISQLRSRPTTEHLPIIVLTARGDEENEVRVFELGADDFLSKPFRARALSARIQAVLARTKR